MWSVILMPMSVWPPAAVSLYLAGGMALQWLLGATFRQDWPQASADYRGAHFYPLPALRQCSQRL